MLKIQSFVFSPFSENTYVVSDETGEAVIIDPGCHNTQERQQLLDYLKDNELKAVKVLNTHCHIDHIFGNAFLTHTLGIPLVAPEKDLYNLEGATLFAKMYSMEFEPSPQPDVLLAGGDTVSFGNTTFEVLFTPGHCAGHVTFWHSEERLVFSGDVLFRGSIGRTDLPGGDMKTLMDSIFKVLVPLGEDVKVYNGHGPVTTIGMEQKTNPFLLNHV